VTVNVLLPAEVGVKLQLVAGSTKLQVTVPSPTSTVPVGLPAPGLCTATLTTRVAALPRLMAAGGVKLTVVLALLTVTLTGVAFAEPRVLASPE